MKATQRMECAYDLCAHNRVIRPGEEITWNRKARGERYHVDCFVKAKGMLEYSPAKHEKPVSFPVDTDTVDLLDMGIDLEAVQELSGDVAVETGKKLKHYLYPLLKHYVANRQHVYLWGAPGSGKSHVAREIAEELGLAFSYISVNPQSPASLLMGYMSVTLSGTGGIYVESELFKRWRDGGVFLFDELDNCSSALLTTLNGMLASNEGSFPCGMIPRHKDFIFIGTGNTTGRGGDYQYPERRKIDEASLDRLVYINWDYDEALEMGLACGVWEARADIRFFARTITTEHKQAWVLWIQQVRKFRANPANAIKGGIFCTPRSAMSGVKDLAYLGSKLFSLADLAERHVFKGADKDTVAKILANVPLPRINGN